MFITACSIISISFSFVSHAALRAVPNIATCVIGDDPFQRALSAPSSWGARRFARCLFHHPYQGECRHDAR